MTFAKNDIWNHASFKNNLRTFLASNEWKFKNAKHSLKKWRSYKKKSVMGSYGMYDV